MTQEVENKEGISIESLSDDSKQDKLGEVGVLDAPDGGRAAWSVIFGCFCVNINHCMRLI